jgi:predicted RNase H-like HicB family nuclease
MTELVFQIEDDPDGGYTAKAVGASIFTEADTLEQLRDNIRDAVTCHFEKPEDRPKIIRLHFTRDEVIAL